MIVKHCHHCPWGLLASACSWSHQAIWIVIILETSANGYSWSAQSFFQQCWCFWVFVIVIITQGSDFELWTPPTLMQWVERWICLADDKVLVACYMNVVLDGHAGWNLEAEAGFLFFLFLINKCWWPAIFLAASTASQLFHWYWGPGW